MGDVDGRGFEIQMHFGQETAGLDPELGIQIREGLGLGGIQAPKHLSVSDYRQPKKKDLESRYLSFGFLRGQE
jgi:hypothetical protein